MASAAGTRAADGGVTQRTAPGTARGAAARLARGVLWWRRGASWLLFCACALVAMRWALFGGWAPLGFYDEGLLFTDAFLMDQGHVVYRDFYVNYPPGTLQLIRLVVALGLPPIWTVRMLAWSEHLLVALAAGLVVGRLRGERLSLATAAVVLILRAKLGLVLSAYRIGVLLALAVIALWPNADSSRGRRLACGALLGVVSYVRHDFFAGAALLLAAFELVHWLARRRSLLAGSARQLAELGAAAAATVTLLWVPLLVEAGLSRTIRDLVVDQTLRVQPGRLLPWPSFSAPVPVAALGWSLPALVADRACVSLLLAFAGTGAAALALVSGAVRGRRSLPELRGAALLTAFAAATLPQALMRTEYGHVAYGLPLTAAALFGTLGRRVALPALLLAVLPNLAVPPAAARLDDVMRFLRQRDDGFYTSPQRRRLARFVESETESHERIFVGCTSHRRVNASQVDVYYLVRRSGATRYMQFDPGTVTSAEGQAEMIADLERHRPRLALLHPQCAWDEPNASRIEGSGLLDEYLAAHYAHSGKVGGLEVWRRIVGDPQPLPLPIDRRAGARRGGN